MPDVECGGGVFYRGCDGAEKEDGGMRTVCVLSSKTLGVQGRLLAG